MGRSKEKWTKSLVTGGNPKTFPGMMSPPAISTLDGKHFIICMSHQLRIYFLQTRQCVRTVDVDLSQAVAFHLDPGSENRVVVFTPSKIFYVNWKEKLDNPIVAEQTISPPFEGLKAVFKLTPSAYYAAAEEESRLVLYVIDRETAVATKVYELDAVSLHSVSSDGHKLAVVFEAGDAALYDISAAVAEQKASAEPSLISASIEATKEAFQGPYKQATCVCVSRSGVMAIGTNSGAIKLLHGGSSTGKTRRDLRWHFDPVASLAFSDDEVYLVSGGNEKVLVFWHLEMDRTQFLPRLAGPIDCISVDRNRPDLYTVALRVSEDPAAYEILAVSAVDLVSRFSASPLRPNFAASARQAVKVARQKYSAHGKDPKVLRHDVTAPVAVHPTSKHLYFARGSVVQAYDVVRGEQAFVQYIVPQFSVGKVRGEHQLQEPSVSALAFTEDGSWMATVDSMPTSDFDNLMSRKDVSFALKFWHWTDSSWSLASKIVDPHGAGVEVGAVLSQGQKSFTTIDSQGGIRVWKPRANHIGGPKPAANAANASKKAPQTVWTLRRARPPVVTAAPVAACYSPDQSLLAVSHGPIARLYDPESLHATDFALPAMDAPIEKLSIVGNFLLIVSQRKMTVFDLVSSCETDLSVQLGSPGVGNIVAVDSTRQLIAVATNQYCSESDFSLRGKILLFRPDSVSPVHTMQHTQAIASLVSTPSGFMFVDTDSRIGVLAPGTSSMADEDSEDLTAQMSKMLVSAQATANILFARSAEESTLPGVTEDIDNWTSHRAIDVAVLQPIFSNVEGVSLDSLFERVVRAVQ